MVVATPKLEAPSDFECWRVAALKALAERGIARRPAHPNGRRFLIVHLDGLSLSTLRRAVAWGHAPFLGRLLRDERYVLTPTYSGAPSSTPSFQAGLLWGAPGDIPGFIWFDKRTGREVRMDRKLDAARVEAEVCRGRRGLLEEGTGYFSIFSGGSCVNAWCLTGWHARDGVRFHSGINAWDLLGMGLAHTVTFARIAGRAVLEAGHGLADLALWAARTGRLTHEWPFYFNRLGLAVGAREYATTAAQIDVVRGVPSIYLCYGDYDEVAHRRGPESPTSLRHLEGIDRSVASVIGAVDAAGMDYDVYLLADHGQVATQPFEEVVGASLKGYLREAMGGGRMVSKDSVVGNVAWLDRGVICVDAGDVAHVYFADEPEPIDLETIHCRHPRVLEAAIRCPGIGILGVRGGRRGYAFRGGEQVDLADPAQAQRLGLGYGHGHVGDAIAEMLAMRSAGDLVAYGNGVHARDLAFAWEFGSHGGVSREEVETFVIHPRGTPFDFGSIGHASDLYRFFTRHYGIAQEASGRG